MATEFEEAALAYARAGRAVFPVNGKAPYTARGFKDASKDEDQIRRWWSTWPNAGIATPIRVGEFVLDVDDLAALDELPHPLPETAEAKTGSGGRHLWFGCAERITNSPGRLPKGVHVRGQGGYVVLPPSKHPDGGAYGWVAAPGECPFAKAPDWLLDLIKPKSSNGSAPPTEGHIGEETRNITLTSLAGTMRRRGMTGSEILAALETVNRERCRPPLDDWEVEQIARSVARYEPATPPVTSFPPIGKGNEETLSPLRELDTRRLLETPPVPIDWLAEGIWARGKFTMPGGREKTGKSLMQLKLACVAATGGGRVAGIAVKPAKVMLIDGENGEDLIQRRLQALGLMPEFSDNLIAVEARGFELRQHLPEVELLLEKHQPDVVLLDSYRTLWRGKERDEDDVPSALDPLRQLAHDSGVAIALIHHAQKNGDEYRGSTAIGACVDWLVMLERVYGDDDRMRRRLTNPLARFAAEYPPRWIRIRSAGEAGPIELEEAEPFDSGPSAEGAIERFLLNLVPVGDWHSRKEAEEGCENEGIAAPGTFSNYFPKITNKPIFEKETKGKEIWWRVKLAS